MTGNIFQAEDKKKREEDKKDLPPVKEDDIPSSQKDPNNSSGCVVSQWSCESFLRPVYFACGIYSRAHVLL